MERMKRLLRRALAVLILMALCVLLSGCRTRITGRQPAGENRAENSGGLAAPSDSSGQTDDTQEPAAAPVDADSPGETRENRQADRREFDEMAAVEIVEGTGRSLHGPGSGDGADHAGQAMERSVPMLDSEAEETASQTVSAEISERLGAADEAEEAASALQYYSVLLEDRLGTLFECKRLTAYLETPEAYTTVWRQSAEHQLLLQAGVYDASSRLLENNLRVDAGWVVRKAPELIVKLVDGAVLGRNIFTTAAAEGVRAELAGRPEWREIPAVRGKRVLLISAELLEADYLRTAAALMIACEAYPELFPDTDPAEALRQLTAEAAGEAVQGICYLSGQGGSWQ